MCLDLCKLVSQVISFNIHINYQQMYHLTFTDKGDGALGGHGTCSRCHSQWAMPLGLGARDILPSLP